MIYRLYFDGEEGHEDELLYVTLLDVSHVTRVAL